MSLSLLALWVLSRHDQSSRSGFSADLKAAGARYLISSGADLEAGAAVRTNNGCHKSLCCQCNTTGQARCVSVFVVNAFGDAVHKRCCSTDRKSVVNTLLEFVRMILPTLFSGHLHLDASHSAIYIANIFKTRCVHIIQCTHSTVYFALHRSEF